MAAYKPIRYEACYLGVLLFIFTLLLVLVFLELPQNWLNLTGTVLSGFNICVCAWLAGTIGGTIFAIKWLYHTVAHNSWNIDRRLWRIFTPHVSGVLALFVILIVSSGLFGFFDPNAVNRLSFVTGLGFLTGYFSDGAAAKLADTATSIFGKTKGHGE